MNAALAAGSRGNMEPLTGQVSGKDRRSRMTKQVGRAGDESRRARLAIRCDMAMLAVFTLGSQNPAWSQSMRKLSL